MFTQRKITFVYLLFCFAVTSIGCMKVSNMHDHQAPSLNSDISMKIMEPLSFYFNSAKNIHNDFLDVEFNAISNNLLDPDSNSHLLSLGMEYFVNTVGYSSGTVAIINKEIIDLLDLPGNTQSNLDSVISIDAYTNQLYAGMVLQTNNFTTPPEAFESILLSKLDEIDFDTSLTLEQKQGYASVLGASAGSYEYWHTNIDIWRQLISPTTDPATNHARLIDFFMRDCAGAGWGGYFGSIVLGMGNVAGAVAGAAILSGLEAMSW